MIDTIHFELEIELNEDRLAHDWTYQKTTYPNGATYVAFTFGQRRQKKDNVYLRYSYEQRDISRVKPKLEVEIKSVSKLFRDDNLAMVPNIELIILLINEELRTKPGITKIDVSNATLKRIDLVYDYHVGCHVSNYLSVISTLEYPHRDRNVFINLRYGSDKKYKGNGVTFFSEAEHTTFYDKQKQSKLLIAEGRLRHERKLTTPRAISRVLGSVILSQVNWSIVRRALEEDLEILGLTKPIESPTSALTKLVKTGSRKELLDYYHFLIFRQYKDRTNKEIAEILHQEADTIRRWRKTLTEKGFCKGYHENEKLTLPPLVLPEKLPNILQQNKSLNRKQQKIEKTKTNLPRQDIGPRLSE